MNRLEKVKEAGQRLLHALWLGWMRHSFPLVRDPRVAELEETLEATRWALSDFDHDGCGDVVDMAEVAVTALGFAQHAAESGAERAAQARAEALEQEERADKAEELLREIRPLVADLEVADALDLIDNYMSEREAK